MQVREYARAIDPARNGDQLVDVVGRVASLGEVAALKGKHAFKIKAVVEVRGARRTMFTG